MAELIHSIHQTRSANSSAGFRFMGRHSTYDATIAENICERIASGETLRSICRDINVHWTTIYDWLGVHEEFSLRFARAREVGYDVIAEECFEIADDGTNDWMERKNEKGEPTGEYMLNGEHVQRSKLRIETRLKLLAKWNPKKYGDKISQEVSGPNGGPIQTKQVTDLTDAELIAIAAQHKPVS